MAIREVYAAEGLLADGLRKLAEHHASEADVHHTARLLAARCSAQLELLRQDAGWYGDPGRDDTSERVQPGFRRLTPEISGDDALSGLRLLRDLSDLYPLAHRTELAWIVLLQAARSARDRALIGRAASGAEEAERRCKWLRTKVEESAPQVLVASA